MRRPRTFPAGLAEAGADIGVYRLRRDAELDPSAEARTLVWRWHDDEGMSLNHKLAVNLVSTGKLDTLLKHGAHEASSLSFKYIAIWGPT